MTAARPAFQEHVHLFRAIAMILIVFQHVVPAFDWSANPQLGQYIQGFSDESSVLFVFIAGYLFQHLIARYDYVGYLRRKFRNVVTPYLVCSIPALLVFTLVAQREGMWPWFYPLPVWQQVGLFLLSGKHLAPYWFMPMICLFYLVSPVFHAIDRRFPVGYWLIVPLVVMSLYLGPDGPSGPLQKAVYMLPVYLTGMWVSGHKAAFERGMTLAWPLLLVLATVCYFGYVLSWEGAVGYAFAMKLSCALLLLYGLGRFNLSAGRYFGVIPAISFGIYFVHSYLITGLKILVNYSLHGVFSVSGAALPVPGSVFAVAGSVVLVFVLSSGVVYAIKAVFGRYSKRIVGA